eukprot:3003581-Pleurochrysis_carterae.AAC.1
MKRACARAQDYQRERSARAHQRVRSNHPKSCAAPLCTARFAAVSLQPCGRGRLRPRRRTLRRHHGLRLPHLRRRRAGEHARAVAGSGHAHPHPHPHPHRAPRTRTAHAHPQSCACDW